MNAHRKLTILTNDRECTRALPRITSQIKILDKPIMALAKSQNVFVITTASKLGEFSAFVRSANESHRLRALFIHADVDAKLLPQMLDRANLRILKNTLVHSDPELPLRVMQAWQVGMQDKLIATAHIIQNNLLAITCALETFEVSFDAVPALRGIPQSERQQFEISCEGSYIHWPNQDIHLDVDSFRYITDASWRQVQDIRRLNEDKRFGAAIASLRKSKGLKQSEVEGLSERQVRRIEDGEPTTVKTLEILAKSHELPLNQYLNEIASEMRKTGAQSKSIAVNKGHSQPKNKKWLASSRSHYWLTTKCPKKRIKYGIERSLKSIS
jgi:transcriptional regulator with XRE-family HTH domain